MEPKVLTNLDFVLILINTWPIYWCSELLWAEAQQYNLIQDIYKGEMTPSLQSIHEVRRYLRHYSIKPSM